ncbi:MAG: F420-dependent methylenetetrahydromethanopterin dehydrogenase [Methanocellales archaeon]|nr:F420-dependent methylenetetrahydromethanopterin dehydrogenase [Methanocellales archaeon]
MAKIGVIKLGNLGISQVVDLLLDERADRDIDVRTAGSGAKMGTSEASYTAKLMEWDPDLVVVVSPNASLPGPKKSRELVGDKPCIIISDAPAKKAVDELKEKGFGYIILKGDPLIGARREFLDPTEMALFNSDALKVLTTCGAARLVQEELDTAIEAIQKGDVKLPQIIVGAETAVNRVRFSNPYAKAKAIAAYKMAELVAEMNVQTCFVIKEPPRYIMMGAAAHEVMRVAALLADAAREIEKGLDKVSRRPHADSGQILDKANLLGKPG